MTGDKDDSRCLHVNVLRPTSISGGPAASCRPPPRPLLAAKFMFDDHIRCMAARQRLVKGRLRARQRKMQMIARLLDLPLSSVDSAAYRPASSRRSPATSTIQLAIPGTLPHCTQYYSLPFQVHYHYHTAQHLTSGTLSLPHSTACHSRYTPRPRFLGHTTDIWRGTTCLLTYLLHYHNHTAQPAIAAMLPLPHCHSRYTVTTPQHSLPTHVH